MAQAFFLNDDDDYDHHFIHGSSESKSNQIWEKAFEGTRGMWSHFQLEMKEMK